MDETGSGQPRTHHSPLGGNYWQVEQDRPLWGLADPHVHLMAPLLRSAGDFVEIWAKAERQAHPDV